MKTLTQNLFKNKRNILQKIYQKVSYLKTYHSYFKFKIILFFICANGFSINASQDTNFTNPNYSNDSNDSNGSEGNINQSTITQNQQINNIAQNSQEYADNLAQDIMNIMRYCHEIISNSTNMREEFSLRKQMRELIKAKIEAGANVNFNTEKDSPLMLAVRFDYTDIVKMLIDNGADIDSSPPDADGLNALSVAIIFKNSNLVNFLLDNHATVDSKLRNGGWSYLSMAAATGSIASTILLLDHGAQINGPDKPIMAAMLNNQPETLALLLHQPNADIEKRYSHGRTLLSIAVRKGLSDMIRILLSIGSNIDTQDNDGMTPLMFAAMSDEKINILAELLNNNADPFLVNRSDLTAYDIAILSDNPIAAKLIEAKVELSMP